MGGMAALGKPKWRLGAQRVRTAATDREDCACSNDAEGGICSKKKAGPVTVPLAA